MITRDPDMVSVKLPCPGKPFIAFSHGLTGYRNVPGKGWYRFSFPFVWMGVGGREFTVRFGRVMRRVRAGE